MPGEAGYETDTNKLKIGDGIRTWSGLPYVGGLAGNTLAGLSDVLFSDLQAGDLVRYSSGGKFENFKEDLLVDGGNF